MLLNDLQVRVAHLMLLLLVRVERLEEDVVGALLLVAAALERGSLLLLSIMLVGDRLAYRGVDVVQKVDVVLRAAV